MRNDLRYEFSNISKSILNGCRKGVYIFNGGVYYYNIRVESEMRGILF